MQNEAKSFLCIPLGSSPAAEIIWKLGTHFRIPTEYLALPILPFHRTPDMSSEESEKS